MNRTDELTQGADMSLAHQQALALAMARHPRLGASSPASVLNSDLIQLVFSFINAAHHQFTRSKRVVSVAVRTGDLVDRIELHYSDGTYFACGGNGGKWRRPLHLNPGEYLVRVDGRKGDFLDAVRFTTNLGTTREFVGRLGGGLPFTMPAIPNGHEIDSLTCSLGGAHLAVNSPWLRSIDALVTRLSPTHGSMAHLLLAHPATVFPHPPNAGFIHRTGALAAGHDLEIRSCTFEEAKNHAVALPNCAGFTFHSAVPRFEGIKEVFFKDNASGNNDWRWQTYLCDGWPGDRSPPADWPGNDHDDPWYNPDEFVLGW